MRKTGHIAILRRLLVVFVTLITFSSCGVQEKDVSGQSYYSKLIGQRFVLKEKGYIRLVEEKDKGMWLISKTEKEYNSNKKGYVIFSELPRGTVFELSSIISHWDFFNGERVLLYGKIDEREDLENIYLGSIINQYIRPEKMYDRSFFVENNFVKPLKE